MKAKLGTQSLNVDFIGQPQLHILKMHNTKTHFFFYLKKKTKKHEIKQS